MAIELGAGFVSLTMEAEGIAADLRKKIGIPAEKEGEESGKEAGKKFTDQFAEQSKKLGGTIADLGKSVVSGLALAGGLAGAALTKGVSDALGAEAANDKLAAQLGLPPDRAAELGAAAGALYRDNYGESLGEVNETIKRVFQDGLVPEDVTNEALNSISAKVLDVSSAFDQDLGGVTRAVGQLMKTGLAPDAETALDIVTRGFQQGADKSEDFLDTLNEYGTQFRKLGIDGTEATGLIIQGLKAGARDGDLVADTLKEFSIRAIDGSKATGTAYVALGLDAEAMGAKIAAGGEGAQQGLSEVLTALKNTEDPAIRAAAATGLFGTQAEDMGDALFALDPDRAAKAMGTVAGAAEEMGATLADNAAAKIETFKRQALGALADFAAEHVIPALARLGTIFQESVLPKLQQFGAYVQTTVIPALQTFGQFLIANVVPALQSMADIAVKVFENGIRPLISFLMDHQAILIGIAVAIGVGLVAAFVAWAVAAGAAAVATIAATLPIIAIGVAIAALVAGIIWAYQNWGFFRDSVDAVASFLKDTLWPILQDVARVVGEVLVAAFNFVRDAIDAVWPVIKTVAEWLGTHLIAEIGKAVEGVKTLIGWFAAIIDAAVNVYTTAKGQFDALVSTIAGLPGQISSAASGMFNGIKEAFRSAINFIINGWNSLSFAIPSIDVPFGPDFPGFSVSTPYISPLAKGGVITSPTLGLLGETSRSRPEIISPQRLMADTFGDVLDKRGVGGGPLVVQLHMDGRQTAEVIVPWEVINERSRR